VRFTAKTKQGSTLVCDVQMDVTENTSN
jgi:hypothetical protein